MDVEDFTRQVKPRKNGSQLLRFQEQIGELKRRGYSDMQIREWLAQNGIAVSRENVRKFIKRHLPNLKDTQQASQASESAPSTGEHQAPTEIRPVEQTDKVEPRESQADRIRRLAEEQRIEADKTKFKHDKTGNNH